jgi:hypothetical protein
LAKARTLVAVPLLRPRRGQLPEPGGVGHPDGITLDDDVEAPVPEIAAGGEDDVGVGGEVHSLLLGRSRAEVEGVVEPHRDEGRDVGSAIVFVCG